MEDRQGFEPWRRSPAYTLSRRAPKTKPVAQLCFNDDRAGRQFAADDRRFDLVSGQGGFGLALYLVDCNTPYDISVGAL